MNILLVLLQAQQGGAGSGLWMIILLFVLMWILMIAPQRKQRKKEEAFRAGLKKGDRVVFSGGIYGKVHSVDTATVEVEVSNGVIMTVEKSMVQAAPETKETKDTKEK